MGHKTMPVARQVFKTNMGLLPRFDWPFSGVLCGAECRSVALQAPAGQVDGVFGAVQGGGLDPFKRGFGLL